MSHAGYGAGGEGRERRGRFVLLVSAAALFCSSMLALGLYPQQQAPRPQAVGVDLCRDCHSTKTIGDQYSVWLNSKHALAYQTLLTDKAREVAKEKNIVGPPHKAAECLRCHVTGYSPKSVTADMFARSFRLEEGVGCEACHGPGSLYRASQDIMSDRRRAMEVGLFIPDEKTCIACHNTLSPTFKTFNYDESLKKIEHPIAKESPTDKGITWLPGMAEGSAAAGENKTPLMISLWFPKGCPICEGLIPVFSDPGVVEAARSLTTVRIQNPTQEYLAGLGLWDAATRFAMPEGIVVVKDMYGSYKPDLLCHVIKRVKAATAAELALRDELARGAGNADSAPLFGLEPVSAEVRDSIEYAYQSLVRMDSAFSKTALKALTDMGDNVRDAALVSWLWSPRSRIKHIALKMISLAHKADSEFFYDLLAFAFDPGDGLRVAALEGLARMGDRRALGPVCQWLLCDHVPEVAEAAFKLVARLGDPQAVPRLLAFFKRPSCCFEEDCPFRFEALVTLYRINDPSMVPTVMEIAANMPLFRRLAVAVLGERGDPSVVPFLLEVAGNDDGAFADRNEAVFMLARIVRSVQDGGQMEAKKLKELRTRVFYGLMPVLLTAENAELRASVCEIFGWLSASSMAAELVRTAREDPSDIPRAYALAALADIFAAKDGPPPDVTATKEQVLELLDAAVASASFLERNMAIDSLERLGVADYLPLQREALRDKETDAPEDRKALTIAAKTLAHVGDRQAVPLLMPLLDDRDLDTSRVVIRCLEELTKRAQGEPGMVPMDIDRLLLAGENAPSIARERMEILRSVRQLNLGWSLWWKDNSDRFEQALREEAAATAGAGGCALDVAPCVFLGEDGEEFSLWLKLRFSGRDGTEPAAQTAMPRGRLKISPNADPAHSGDSDSNGSIMVVLNAAAWREVRHEKDPAGNDLKPAEPRIHSWQGELYVPLSSGFKIGKQKHAGVVVEFVGQRGPLRVEVPSFEY
ncbi:MAG: HEAT repeat domain-containing protein [Planctomycetota bacterium]|nr:HEAT repeat domain-containing protein [Planctomycetota bacterium]